MLHSINAYSYDSRYNLKNTVYMYTGLLPWKFFFFFIILCIYYSHTNVSYHKNINILFYHCCITSFFGYDAEDAGWMDQKQIRRRLLSNHAQSFPEPVQWQQMFWRLFVFLLFGGTGKIYFSLLRFVSRSQLELRPRIPLRISQRLTML